MTREYVEVPPMNGEQLCDLIAEVFRPQKDGRPMTPPEIWNASPTGELWHLVLGYDAYAVKHRLLVEVDRHGEQTGIPGTIRYYREVPET